MINEIVDILANTIESDNKFIRNLSKFCLAVVLVMYIFVVAFNWWLDNK